MASWMYTTSKVKDINGQQTRLYVVFDHINDLDTSLDKSSKIIGAEYAQLALGCFCCYKIYVRTASNHDEITNDRQKRLHPASPVQLVYSPLTDVRQPMSNQCFLICQCC